MILTQDERELFAALTTVQRPSGIQVNYQRMDRWEGTRSKEVCNGMMFNDSTGEYDESFDSAHSDFYHPLR